MERLRRPWGSNRPERQLHILRTPARMSLVTDMLSGMSLAESCNKRFVSANAASSVIYDMRRETEHPTFEAFFVDLVLSQPDPTSFVRSQRPPTSANLYFYTDGLLNKRQDIPRGRKPRRLTELQVKQLLEYQSIREDLTNDTDLEGSQKWDAIADQLRSKAFFGYFSSEELSLLREYSKERSLKRISEKLQRPHHQIEAAFGITAYKMGISSGGYSTLQTWLEAIALGLAGKYLPPPRKLIRYPEAADDVARNEASAL